MLDNLVYDLLVILAAGLVAGLLCRKLGMSMLVGYLVVGALIGKGLLGWVSDDRHEVEMIAEAGVFLLLFSIGLEFSLDELARLGRNLAIGGSVQMLIVAVPVAVVLISAGINWRPAVLIAAAASFSSTVLVFKALSEWGHSSLPHGHRAIGILLFQDAALIPLLLLVPMLTGAGKAARAGDYLLLAVMSLLFVASVIGLRYALEKKIIPLFASYRSPELIVLFTMVLLGGVTLASWKMGLPPAVGAFAAGLIFSGNRWTKQVDALVLPFRETFSTVFFVSLGLLFDPKLLVNEPLLMLLWLVGLVVLKAAAATIALRLTGLNWKASAGMGIGLAHIGEFAFVLVLLGWESGVIGDVNYQRIVGLAIGSLVLTPLLLKTGLKWTGGATPEAGIAAAASSWHTTPGRQAIVIGAGLIGRHLTSRLETVGKDVCLIDLSPVNLIPFAQQGFRTIAGDATDPGLLSRASPADASMVFVCVPDDNIAVRVVRNVRQVNPECFILVRCRYELNVSQLKKAGADRVVAEESQASEAILRIFNELDARE